jgi:oligopeptide/dipeptide ABC transporter ATP-binding protein
MSGTPLVEVRGLSISLAEAAGTRRLVQDMSFRVDRGECLALVGESGSGKTLTAFSVLGLYPSPDIKRSAGRVLIEGEDLDAFTPAALRRLRGGRLGMIFQEPSQALNPVRRVETHLREVLGAHATSERGAWPERMRAVLGEVGLPDPERLLRMYPFELSGGMMQRVCIAMALLGEPELLIADEPTTALDPTVSRRIIDLFASLRKRRELGLLYISHDLHWVSRIADRVAVLYAGRLLELGGCSALLEDARHPYTSGLVHALDLDDEGRFRAIPGDIRDRPAREDACPFLPRCPRRLAACAEAMPALDSLGPGRMVACWNPLGGDGNAS